MKHDGELIHQAVAGDLQAFERLVVKYQERLYGSLVHVIGCADEAEDVAQEAFVQAYLKLSKFEGRSGFYTWIYRIAINKWLSRKRRRRERLSLDGHDQQHQVSDPQSPPNGPVDCVERQERIERVQDAIARLEDSFRSVLVMRELDGFSYETIAECLEIPIGTVRSRLYRARMLLKKDLEPYVSDSTP